MLDAFEIVFDKLLSNDVIVTAPTRLILLACIRAVSEDKLIAAITPSFLTRKSISVDNCVMLDSDDVTLDESQFKLVVWLPTVVDMLLTV